MDDGIVCLDSRTHTVGGRAHNTSYTYEAGTYGAASTTPLIKSINQDGKTTTYTYDDAGNIQSVDTPFNPVQVEDLTGKLYEQGGKRLYTKDETGLERILYAMEGKGQAQITTSKVNYAYDKLGQLIRVDDPYDQSSGQQGTTTTYAYDLGGNILEKRVFPYTLPTEQPIGAVKVVHYAYADTNWKDKLTSYNGTAITYDAIGNPLNDGTWSFNWESGRQLQSMTKTNDTTVTYAYNVDGLRIRKSVNGIATDYTLHGKQVVHMKKNSDNLHFFYDTQARPAVVEWNGVKYGYVHNLQGDIVAIVDGSGNRVVEYTYDAWGKPLTMTGTLATTLGTLNPFRYRGYVFDEETGLYYLRSRYYNPVWGRFINSDTIIGNAWCILNHNVFSYCINSPLAFSDASGHMYDSSCVDSGLDYTKIIDEALAQAVEVFKNRSVGNGSPSTLAQMISNLADYFWFYKQVDHHAPWDIKRDGPWRQQFPDLPIPKTKFLYRGKMTSRADLGNFTYGYLGTAMGIHSEFLYLMGGAATFTEGRAFGVITIMDAVEKALAK